MHICVKLAVVLLVLAGCQSIPQHPTEYKPLAALDVLPKAGQAIVYVYRPTQGGTKAGAVDFYLNEQLVVSLPDEAYTRLDLLPGHYRITAHLVGSESKGWLPPGEFDVAAGGAMVVYPVAILDSAKEIDWTPLLISVAGIVISKGQYIPIPTSMERTVTTERSRSWQLSTDPGSDAFVDRMRRGTYLAPALSSVRPLQNG
jgi:hypothetical protein